MIATVSNKHLAAIHDISNNVHSTSTQNTCSGMELQCEKQRGKGVFPLAVQYSVSEHGWLDHGVMI